MAGADTNTVIQNMVYDIASGYTDLLRRGVSMSVSDYLLIRKFAVEELHSHGDTIAAIAPVSANATPPDTAAIPRTHVQEPTPYLTVPSRSVTVENVERSAVAADLMQAQRPQMAAEAGVSHADLSEFEILRSIRDEWN